MSDKVTNEARLANGYGEMKSFGLKARMASSYLQKFFYVELLYRLEVPLPLRGTPPPHTHTHTHTSRGGRARFMYGVNIIR